MTNNADININHHEENYLKPSSQHLSIHLNQLEEDILITQQKRKEKLLKLQNDMKERHDFLKIKMNQIFTPTGSEKSYISQLSATSSSINTSNMISSNLPPTPSVIDDVPTPSAIDNVPTPSTIDNVTTP